MTAKYIGPQTEGIEQETIYSVQTQKMTGKRYKPGKTENDKWIDTVGEKDNRIMAWIPLNFQRTAYYKVFEDENHMAKHFEQI